MSVRKSYAPRFCFRISEASRGSFFQLCVHYHHQQYIYLKVLASVQEECSAIYIVYCRVKVNIWRACSFVAGFHHPLCFTPPRQPCLISRFSASAAQRQRHASVRTPLSLRSPHPIDRPDLLSEVGAFVLSTLRNINFSLLHLTLGHAVLMKPINLHGLSLAGPGIIAIALIVHFDQCTHREWLYLT